MREPEAAKREKHERDNQQDQSNVDHDGIPPPLMITLRAVLWIFPPSPGGGDVVEFAPAFVLAFAVEGAQLQQEPGEDAPGENGDAKRRRHKKIGPRCAAQLSPRVKALASRLCHAGFSRAE